MCECIKKLNETFKNTGLDVELMDKNKLYIDYFACACGSFSIVIEINYCPICGEKLKEIKNNEII